jgi:hypothetical protein
VADVGEVASARAGSLMAGDAVCVDVEKKQLSELDITYFV